MVKGPVIATFVLTLVSILSAQPIAELIEEKSAKINVSILEGNFLETTFMVSNTGNRPAGLSQVQIATEGVQGDTYWFLKTELDKKLIEPGKAYILTATNGSVIPSPVPHEHLSRLHALGIKKNCDLVLEYVQMNGVKYRQHLPFICDDVTNVKDPLADAPVQPQ